MVTDGVGISTILIHNLSSLAATLENVKQGYEECREKISALEDRIGKMEYDSRSRPNKEEEWSEVVRNITREEAQLESRRNNVVLSCVGEPEEDCVDENIEQVVQDIIPQIQGEIVSAVRLGRKGSTRTTPKSKQPRRILLCLTPRGKSLIWETRRTLSWGDHPVYVNHDLTPKEQAARRAVVPKFKALRDKNVRCSLPRSTILGEDGQPLTEKRIRELLDKAVDQSASSSADTLA